MYVMLAVVESIALPAAPCGDAEFYYEPNRTRLRCNDFCPPAVSDDRNVEFCRRNCPGRSVFYNSFRFLGQLLVLVSEPCCPAYTALHTVLLYLSF